VFLRAVGASLGVSAGSVAVLPVLVVDTVSLLTELALLVVVDLFMVASASSASDLTVGVDLVTEFPAMGALNEVDLLSPLGQPAGGVEDDKGVQGEGFDP